MTEQSMLKHYLVGQGLDTSAEQKISGDNVRHRFAVADNLYRFYPEEGFSPESYDFVYNSGQINQNKFYKVLFKEWWSMVKVGGYLIVEFEPNKTLNAAGFKSIAENLMGDTGEILYHEDDKPREIFVCKKNKNILVPGDSINKWTFGIITVGTRNDWLEKIIKSIRDLNIPEYEIIVCGKYYDRGEPDVSYIHFEEQDDKGWITKKKNLICAAAKYENIVVTNDRILYNPDWFTGMKKYGNFFESLGCVQKLDNGQRVGDWMTFGEECRKANHKFPRRPGMLEYRDWDEWSYIVGSLNIIKKSVWQKEKWDEDLFWVDAIEDGVICHQATKQGMLTRFNPYASCLSLSWRHGVLPIFKFNQYALGRRTGVPLRRLGWFFFYWAEQFGVKRKWIAGLAEFLRKLGVFEFIRHH